MDDPGLRLAMLRFLEQVQERDLARTRHWIEDEVRRQAERQRGERARPPVPDWLLEQGLSGRMPVYVHVGGCHMAGKRSHGIKQDQALTFLADGVDPCPHCRPDTELRFLEG